MFIKAEQKPISTIVPFKKKQHKPVNSYKLVQQAIFKRIGDPVKPGTLVADHKKSETFVYLKYGDMSVRLYDRSATIKKKGINHVMKFSRKDFGRFLTCINPSQQPLSDFFKHKV